MGPSSLMTEERVSCAKSMKADRGRLGGGGAPLSLALSLAVIFFCFLGALSPEGAAAIRAISCALVPETGRPRCAHAAFSSGTRNAASDCGVCGPAGTPDEGR